MSQTETNKDMESIRSNADGFSFINPDSNGSDYAVVCGPITAVPTSLFPDISEDEAHRLFRIVYPKLAAYTVYTDVIPELDVTILTGINEPTELPVKSHMYKILSEMSHCRRGVLAAVSRSGMLDIAAVRNSRLLLLNTVRNEDSYTNLYYIVKTWKELGFKSGIDDIKLFGADLGNQAFIDRLRLMTGVIALCE